MKPRTQSILNIVLLVLVFPVCALLVKDILAYRYALRGVEVTRPAVRPPARAADLREYSGIVEAPVFPTPAEKFTPLSGVSQAPRPSGGPAPGAAIGGLKLTGTYVGARALAVFVKTDGMVEGAFAEGEDVFGRGTLKRVGKISAVLDVNGTEVVINMPEEDLPKAQPLSLLPAVEPAVAPAPGPTGARPTQDSLTRQTGENQWVVSQAAVLNALDDIGSVLSAARLTPVKDGTDVTGFLLTEIRPRGIMDAIGLKNGDVLKRVNGYEITTPERAVQVLSALKGETSFDIDIVRRGENLSLHYDIR